MKSVVWLGIIVSMQMSLSRFKQSTYLCFKLFRKCFDDFQVHLEYFFSEMISKIYGNRNFRRFGVAQQPEAPTKMIWAPIVFAAAPNTLPVGLLTSQLLPFWAP